MTYNYVEDDASCVRVAAHTHTRSVDETASSAGAPSKLTSVLCSYTMGMAAAVGKQQGRFSNINAASWMLAALHRGCGGRRDRCLALKWILKQVTVVGDARRRGGHSEVSESVAVEVLRVPQDDLRFEKMRAFTCRGQERGAHPRGACVRLSDALFASSANSLPNTDNGTRADRARERQIKQHTPRCRADSKIAATAAAPPLPP